MAQTKLTDAPGALTGPQRIGGALRRAWSRDLRLRFLVVGAYNTAFGLASFPLLFLAFGRRAPYLALLVIAHVLAVTNAFVAHRTLAFRASGGWWGQYARFFVGQLGVLGFGLVTLPLLVGRVGLSPLAAQPMLAVIAVLFSYFWHHRVTFPSRSERGAPRHEPPTTDAMSEPRGLRPREDSRILPER